MSERRSRSAALEPHSSVAGYLLGLADDALVYAQRLGGWVARSPELEIDVAVGNIALDQLGQARALLTRVGELDGSGATEDDLAMFRDARAFRNVQLVELATDDFGVEMARLLLLGTYQHALYAALTTSTDPVVAGVAGKAVKEVAYHHTYAAGWVVRLGDGTASSHERMQAALATVAPYQDELFEDDPSAVLAADVGVGVLPSTLRAQVEASMGAVLAEASLAPAEPPSWRARGGRSGRHTEGFGLLLAELQQVARAHPGATW